MTTDSEIGRLVVCVLPTVLLFGSGSPRPAEAQDETPKYELFVGYAPLRDQDTETNFPAGWNMSMARSFTNSVGVVADVGGNYKTEEGVDLNLHAFLGGVRYSFRGETVTPYVEVLAGAARAGASAAGMSDSATDFAVQGGLGLGVKIAESVWLRVGGDFRNIFSEGESTQQLRALAGVSFGFGGTLDGGGPARRRTSSAPASRPSPQAVPPATPAPARRTPAVEAPVQQPQPARPSAAATPELAQLARGCEALTAGAYSQASDAFREYLGTYASYKLTIPVGIYCERSNVAQQVSNAGDCDGLFLLRLMRRGRFCYGLYWGVFDSWAQADAGLNGVPPALRAPGQTPISVSRILSRAR